MKTALLAALIAVLCAGCAALNSIIVTTQTVLGVSVTQNPTTQLYEARGGYGRNEYAYIPRGTNGSVPNVIMELRVNNLFAGGTIYQRLAVGETAVNQPGAALLFAKDSKGSLSVSNLVSTMEHLQAVRPNK